MNDQTILSKPKDSAPEPSGSEKKRNPLLIIGGIGCALLLCAGLLVGAGFWWAGGQLEELTAGLPSDAPPPATEEALTATATDAAETTPEATATTAEVETEATEEPAAPTAEPTPAEPEIGQVTFALDATEDYEPIDPGDSFEVGLTEIHAIFEYSGMSPSYTWERVWYLDGQEMLRSEEAWSGAETGIFDYFINAGGEPLSPGEWTLELYVNDELVVTDSFIIEATETAAETPTAEAIAETTVTATPALIEPTGTPTATATSRPRPVQVHKLAFTRWDGGQHLLFVSDTNGGPEQFILRRAAGPSWTPDGQFIFFYGEAGVDRQVVDGVDFVFEGITNGIIRLDAAPVPTRMDQVRLFQGPGWNDGTARWANVSPNGAMVAYDARPGGDYRIYFLGTEENQQFRFEILGEQADWSPDSQKVVYRSGRDGKTGIWISNRDDSGHTLITNNGSDSFPAWSPDGQTIVFSREEGGNVDLYAVNTEGGNLRRLTDAPGPDTLATFTPAGQIIFRSARSGSWGIWKMNQNGSSQQAIIPDAAVGPDWTHSRMSVGP